MLPVKTLAALTGISLLVIAVSYLVCVLLAHWRWSRAAAWAGGACLQMPVSIFKPLCGAEAGLYENLRSFCTQDYPAYEILFGVHSACDPALSVVRRLMNEFPALAMTAVIDEQSHGSNRKVSNLLNMTRHARYDHWVLSDSDAQVTPDYLRVVTAPLKSESVGLVTCPYRDLPSPNIWSRLAALYVNDWFMPSVIFSWALGRSDYVSGQTICLRRDTVELIGGFGGLRNLLADDYELGALIRRTGRSIVLSHYIAGVRHHEPTLRSLLQHETRWLRTIAVLQPGSFRGLFLTFSLPLALLGFLLTAGPGKAPATALGLILSVIALRLGLHGWMRDSKDRSFFTDLWLIPVRDLLTVYAWACAFRATRLTWRGMEFAVADDGIMQPTTERSG